MSNQTIVTTPATQTPQTVPPVPGKVRKPQSAQTQAAQRLVRFELDIPEARNVFVAGTFNDWKPEATGLASIGGATWFVDLLLAPGRYEYRFVVNGEWMDPPKAKAYVPNPHGGRNGVVKV